MQEEQQFFCQNMDNVLASSQQRSLCSSQLMDMIQHITAYHQTWKILLKLELPLFLQLTDTSVHTSDVTARLGWLVARLRHWSRSKWLLAALSGSELAKLTEIARSCGLAILVVFIPYLCILAIKYDV